MTRFALGRSLVKREIFTTVKMTRENPTKTCDITALNKEGQQRLRIGSISLYGLQCVNQPRPQDGNITYIVLIMSEYNLPRVRRVKKVITANR